MFARHLILQGYTTDQVTILTTYRGQLFILRSVSSHIFFFKCFNSYDNLFCLSFINNIKYLICTFIFITVILLW